MKTYVIDGLTIENPEQLHDALQKALPLPDYYGRNLDALHDVLTEWREDFTLRIDDCDSMLSALETYGVYFMRMLNDAAGENEHFLIDLE